MTPHLSFGQTSHFALVTQTKPSFSLISCTSACTCLLLRLFTSLSSLSAFLCTQSKHFTADFTSMPGCRLDVACPCCSGRNIRVHENIIACSAASTCRSITGRLVHMRTASQQIPSSCNKLDRSTKTITFTFSKEIKKSRGNPSAYEPKLYAVDQQLYSDAN